MRYLVTGGAGFIGSNLADRLLARHDDVVILDDLSRSGVDANLEWLRDRYGPTAFRLVRAKVQDRPHLESAMHDVHGELYLAPTPDREGNAMGNMAAVRDGLNRSQMEFVASRTSLLNDCFF